MRWRPSPAPALETLLAAHNQPVPLPPSEAPIAKARVAAPTFKSLEGEPIPTVVELDNATSDTRTIIDLQAEDRVGLLYDVSRALTELNERVYLAKISTEKGAAIGTFYITEHDGAKVLDPERQKTLKLRLRRAIQRGS
jgi:UTP:GlnB (protein PII) uridylyltransferase